MALTSRRKRPLNRNIQHLRDTKLYIIATEGEKTEKLYFGMFRNIRVQVKVIPSEAGLSAPEYVLKRLRHFKEEYQLSVEDELWLMVDVDRWGDKKLNQICSAAVQQNFQLAVSNPCFEVWLYLHFADLPSDEITCKQVTELLRQHLGGYSKTNIEELTFKPHIQEAIQRASQLHSNLNERWPSMTGTHVYKVVEKLIK